MPRVVRAIPCGGLQPQPSALRTAGAASPECRRAPLEVTFKSPPRQDGPWGCLCVPVGLTPAPRDGPATGTLCTKPQASLNFPFLTSDEILPQCLGA